MLIGMTREDAHGNIVETWTGCEAFDSFTYNGETIEISLRENLEVTVKQWADVYEREGFKNIVARVDNIKRSPLSKPFLAGIIEYEKDGEWFVEIWSKEEQK